MNILITGANGFVGAALSQRLRAEGQALTVVGRTPGGAFPADREIVAQTDFENLSEHWPATVRCDVAVHLAARVHVMQKTGGDPIEAYRQSNVTASLRVAAAAAQAGVKRFIYISSIKAMGEGEPGVPPHPWKESDTARPSDPYGVSKREAELALQDFCAAHRMALVVIRPPLVYGPGVRANFLQMLSIVRRGLPLPLGAVRARRSMICVDNLVDVIRHCLFHPHAPGRSFHVSDGKDVSVPEMIRILAMAMNRPARLIPLPPAVLEMLARCTGRGEQADRLLRPFRLDISLARNVLAWKPPVDAETALQQTAIWYRDAFIETSS